MEQGLELKGTPWLSCKEITQGCLEKGMAGALMSDSSDAASSCFCSGSVWSGVAFSGKRLGQSDIVAHLCPFLQERYRQDCNLAVQLLKCNKSHFRNHKFADVSSIPVEVGKKGSWSPPASGFLCRAVALSSFSLR